MSIRVSIDQLRERLPELLNLAAESGEECIIQRDGEDYAVLLSAREWEQDRRKGALTRAQAEAQERLARAVGQWPDALGPEYRLSGEKQARLEELLTRKQELSAQERAELDALMKEGDAIMLRRADALDRIR